MDPKNHPLITRWALVQILIPTPAVLVQVLVHQRNGSKVKTLAYPSSHVNFPSSTISLSFSGHMSSHVLKVRAP
jgi:hypothetical protein